MLELFLVRPNLGNPMMLTPEKLTHFEVTIAAKNPVLRNLALVRGLLMARPPKIARTDKPDKTYALTILKVKKLKNYAGFKADYSSQKLPITNTDHQYTRGFRFEFIVEVGLTEARIQQIKDQGDWPVLCNLEYNQKHNMHALYIHNALKDNQTFTIIQLSDLHVAHRNDTIPQLLSEVRTPQECETLKSRYINFNDHLRTAIAQINQRVKQGEAIVVAATGDLIDYYYDGFWDSEFIWKKGKAIGWENCNFNKLYQILIGSDGKGAGLQCPIFTVLGNHDYLIHETLPNVDINALSIKLSDKDSYRAFGLTVQEGREYCFWAYPKNKGKSPSLPERKLYKNYSEMPKGKQPFHLRRDVDLDTNHSYWMGKPHYEHLGFYLEKINYDVNFSITLGQQQLICLNTGPDRYGTKGDFISASSGIGSAPDYVHDYIHGGPHNRGISTEHIKLVNTAMKNETARGAVLIFTHAPLVGLQNDPTQGHEVLFEEQHAQMPKPPNLVSRFFSNLYGLNFMRGPFTSGIAMLNKMGYPLHQKKYFMRGQRDPQLNFGCADSLQTNTLFQLFGLIRRPAAKPVMVLSGHTHKAHEFRIEGPKTVQEKKNHIYAYFIDDYSKKIKQQSNLAKKWVWFKKNSPLLLTSGGMKNKVAMAPKYEEHYREIKIENDKLHSIDRVLLKARPLTTTLTPGCRPVGLRAANGNYVSADHGGGGWLVANRAQRRKWETFELFQWAGGKAAVRCHQGDYWRAEGGGGKAIKADKKHIQAHETFYMFSKGANQVIFQSKNGQYIALDREKRLVATSKQIGAAAKFTRVDIRG
ncbi:metallophosphoesterase [bacterium]|nr:metallophosphoesterase [bacterium]